MICSVCGTWRAGDMQTGYDGDEMCHACVADGWDEVCCPECRCRHLARPGDRVILADCAWAKDQNRPTFLAPRVEDYDERDEADLVFHALTDEGGL